jgi:hypothetical protein
VLELAAKELPPTAPDIDAEADLAIMICDGDVRAALKASLVANAFLEQEVERMRQMQSAGYGAARCARCPCRNGQPKSGTASRYRNAAV